MFSQVNLETIIKLADKNPSVNPTSTNVDNAFANSDLVSTGNNLILFILCLILLGIFAAILILKNNKSKFNNNKFLGNLFASCAIDRKIIMFSIWCILSLSLIIFLFFNKFAYGAQINALNVNINPETTINIKEDGQLVESEINITNNENYPVNISMVNFSNNDQNQTIWNAQIVRDNMYSIYNHLGDNTPNNVSYNIDPGTTQKIIIQANIKSEEIENLYGKDIAKANFSIKPVNYDADFYCTGVGKQEFNCAAKVNFNFDFGMFKRINNTEFSNDIGSLCALFATAAKSDTLSQNPESRECNVLIDGYPWTNNDRVDPFAFGKTLGFEDNYYFDLYNFDQEKSDAKVRPKNADISKYDKDDMLAYYLGHKKIDIDGEQSEVIMVSMAGTNGSLEEWASDFDCGADDESYYSKVGSSDQHPDWVNKENHKGLDVTSNRVKLTIDSYIAGNTDQDPNTKKYLIITGHSRGGGAANILGSIYEKDTRYKTFTYAFASPNTTQSKNWADYKTVFNIINNDDAVTIVPPNQSGYYRYGKDFVVSIMNDKASSGTPLVEYFKKYAAFKEGQEYQSPSKEIIDDAVKSLVEVIPNDRAKIYENTSMVYENSQPLPLDSPDPMDPTKGINGLKDSIDNFNKKLGLDIYCEFSIEKDSVHTDKYNLKKLYCTGFVMKFIANIITDPTIIQEGIPSLTDEHSDVLSKYILCASKGLKNPHSTASYYAIVHECFF